MQSYLQLTTMFSLTALISVIVLGYTIYVARWTDYTAICKQIGTSLPSVKVHYTGLLSTSSGDGILNQNHRIPRLRRCYPSLGGLQHPTIRLRS